MVESAEMIGKNVNGFQVIEKLGEGGMADVYKAVDLKLEREVAIKFLRINARNDQVSRKRFENEAKALAKLRHPNIVPVLTYGEYRGRPYLVMDYIPGGNLKQMLGKPIPWHKAAALLLPIAKALDYAHSKNIIHRDVKPSNILINEDGEPMLSDFGVAKLLGTDETLDLTGTSVGVGTPYYMSPEQGRNTDIGPQSDIYSLGVVYYEMITGRKPYNAETPMAVILKHIEEPLPSPSKTRPGVSRVADTIVFTALAKDPKDRYKTMSDMASAFEKAASGSPQIPLPSRKVWTFVGVGVIALGLIYGVYRFGSGSGSTSAIGQEEGADVKQSPSTLILTTSSDTTQESQYDLVFQQDFENGNLDGITIKQGNWILFPGGKNNTVLQVRETASLNWPYIEFGPKDFSNGVIEFKFTFHDVDIANPDSGYVYSLFRVNGGWNEDSYTMQANSQMNFMELDYIPPSSPSWNELSATGIFLEKDKWYDIRIEINEWDFIVFLDGNILLKGTDGSHKQSSGRLGFQSSPDTTIWFDDVKVYTSQE